MPCLVRRRDECVIGVDEYSCAGSTLSGPQAKTLFNVSCGDLLFPPTAAQLPIAQLVLRHPRSRCMHQEGHNKPPHLFGAVNRFGLRYMTAIEMTGVLMRIFSFSLVSWLGPESPFMFVWIFNTADAVLLSWCAILRKDKAYITLNVFWVLVGIVGILRAGGLMQ
jgi:hypothetical protein